VPSRIDDVPSAKEFPMSSIRTMCPHCIAPLDLEPAEILLVATPSAGTTGSYAYYCRGCERVTVAAVSPAGFSLLVTAGAAVPGYEPQQRPVPSAPRLTVDDLIDFHELLNSPDWFLRLHLS
jgi:hypothetical protein